MSCEHESRDAQLDGPTYHESSFPVRPGRQRLEGGPDKGREKACALRIRVGGGMRKGEECGKCVELCVLYLKRPSPRED